MLLNIDIYFLANRSEGQHQGTLLAKVIAQVFIDFDKLTYPDWESMFRAVSYRIDKRFTLCLDEFMYLMVQSPELPSVLWKLVDEKQLKYNLVLWGSSQNMMYGVFLDSKVPLNGRADEIMKLMQMCLPYIPEALNIDAKNAVEEYFVWGGVLLYWGLKKNRRSFDDALWHNVFSVNGVLYGEPIKLFQDDVRDIVKTSTIMSYISTGANRLPEIVARYNELATNLSCPLKKLVDLGLLERAVSFGSDEKNAKRSLYKIADPFLGLCHKFIVHNRSFIELDRCLLVEHALTAHFSEYVSTRWEKLCREAITGNLVSEVVYGKAKRWRGSVLTEEKKPKQVELDVMAESFDKKYLLVGECKWTTKENGKQLTTELLRKVNLLLVVKNYAIVPVLFLKNIVRKMMLGMFCCQKMLSS